MDQDLLNQFKQKLDDMEADLRDALTANPEATAPVQLDSSIGRLSRMDAMQNQQIAINLKSRQQQHLMRVESALEAVRKGTYGKCHRCKGSIAIERLEAQPDALFCIVCAEKGGR